MPPGNSSKEAVKAKVERCFGARSLEVFTEDGAMQISSKSPSPEENKGGLPESETWLSGWRGHCTTGSTVDILA